MLYNTANAEKHECMIKWNNSLSHCLKTIKSDSNARPAQNQNKNVRYLLSHFMIHDPYQLEPDFYGTCYAGLRPDY